MLILSRRVNESIIIGDDVEVTIVAIRGDKIRLGISAPRTTGVHRLEIWQDMMRGGHGKRRKEAAAAAVGGRS